MNEQVKFRLSGQIGSNNWGYIAWYGTSLNKTASVELYEGRYIVHVLGKREDLPANPLPDFKTLDEKMYASIKCEAERDAEILRTSVDDTATRERESQLVNLK